MLGLSRKVGETVYVGDLSFRVTGIEPGAGVAFEVRRGPDTALGTELARPGKMIRREDVIIQVLRVRGKRVVLAIDAPREKLITRS